MVNKKYEDCVKGVECEKCEVCELKMTRNSKKELDLMYEDAEEVNIFEIKFHRKISKKGFAYPDSAGRVFSDVLHSFKEKNVIL